jgi:hypothetical protein
MEIILTAIIVFASLLPQQSLLLNSVEVIQVKNPPCDPIIPGDCP